MRRALLGRAVAVGLVASGALGALAAAPAKADCVEAHVEVRYESGTTWYPLGGPHHCVVPTSWQHFVEGSAERDFHDPPEGLPSYVWVHIWVPMP